MGVWLLAGAVLAGLVWAASKGAAPWVPPAVGRAGPPTGTAPLFQATATQAHRQPSSGAVPAVAGGGALGIVQQAISYAKRVYDAYRVGSVLFTAPAVAPEAGVVAGDVLGTGALTTT